MDKEVVTIYNGKDACHQCEGWKRIANDEDQSSWRAWAELPDQASLAVKMGLVKPILCPHCKGTGVEPTDSTNHKERVRQ